MLFYKSKLRFSSLRGPNQGSIKSQKHVRCETRGFFDVQIVIQNNLSEADGVLLAKLNSRKQ